jgi:hypothetical protein
MFEDLRRSVSEEYEQFEDQPTHKMDEEPEIENYAHEATAERTSEFLGMTAPQRFVIALMLFFMVLILGCFFLVLSGKIVLPIF